MFGPLKMKPMTHKFKIKIWNRKNLTWDSNSGIKHWKKVKDRMEGLEAHIGFFKIWLALGRSYLKYSDFLRYLFHYTELC